VRLDIAIEILLNLMKPYEPGMNLSAQNQLVDSLKEFIRFTRRPQKLEKAL
jgi:hypothetical protein